MTIETSGRTDTYALLGHPVSRSLSPRLHSALFRHTGIDAVYVCMDVDPNEPARIIESVRTLGLAGVNLTVPLKESVLPFLDRLDASAETAGAVNTVVREDRSLVGYNTDGDGLIDAIDEYGWPVDRPAVILGAGGTARAVAAALKHAGCPEITLLNRTVSRAARAANTLGVAAGSLTNEAFAAATTADSLIVNCTGGEAAALVEALPVHHLDDRAGWIDVNYWMKDPPMAQVCEARGIAFMAGHTMLLHQGIRAWSLWMKRTPTIAAIQAARDAIGAGR